jgi:hypothetical protein
LKAGEVVPGRLTPRGRAAHGFGAAVLALLGIGLSQGSALADDHVTIRGQYYREPSTRVVQPVVELSKDLPHGIDVTAHYLLDAITSASAASGPAGDTIFTESRSEEGLSVGKSWSRVRVGVSYRYSGESDYWSHFVVGSLTLRVWDDTGTLSATFGGGWDQVGRRVQGSTPMPKLAPGCGHTCPLDTTMGGLWYSQVLSPTVLVQAGYEVAYLDGFQSSPYRTVSSHGGMMENVPRKRWRNVAAVRAAKYFPAAGLGLQLHYRYYWDFSGDAGDATNPWNVRSHTVEGRIYQSLGRDLELRLTGRYYSQGSAGFWCDAASAAGCDATSRYFTSDPKLGSVTTKLLELKIYWDAAIWRDLPFFGWFAAGTFELSYGHFWQDTTFADAHVAQAGYTFPF